MKHRSVRRDAASEMMALYKTRKPAALAGSDDMNQFVLSEDVHHYLIARISRFVALNQDFAHEPRRRDIPFLEMACHRLAHALRFYKLDEAELHGIVAVLLLRLLLNDNARAGLNDRPMWVAADAKKPWRGCRSAGASNRSGFGVK